MADRRTIEVGALARVEGQGALHLTVEEAEVVDLRLEIYEPPRLFEAFSRGRRAAELPDLLARICGICPVAYQMSSVQAVEAAWGVEPDPAVRALRRLYYAGEWMESHLLHMVFLGAPDYLELDDGVTVARLHPAEVERALRLRKLGNRILVLLGARPVNPVGVAVGGFHRAPRREELAELRDELARERGEAEALLRWFTGLAVPRRPQEIELVALRHPRDYPMNEGRVISTHGLDLPVEDWQERFEETQVPHSTALHARIRERGAYMVGPLARVWLNRDRLAPAAAAALESVADRFETPDPAASVFARGIEVVQAIDDAIAVIDGYAPPPPLPEAIPRAGRGHGATEAPRGLLYIAVETDDAGDVRELRIVPPTSQNQARIEDDLRATAPDVLRLESARARRVCESVIRDYDPCISCSVHFLELHVEHRDPSCGSG